MFCKVCGSSNNVRIFDASNMHGRHILDKAVKFTIYRCDDCTTVFVGGITVDKEYFSKYYPYDYYESEIANVFVNQLAGLFCRMVAGFKESEILRHASRSSNTKLKILDIGCGSGEFLASINPVLFEKYGQEINPQGIEKCRRRNIEVIDKGLIEARLDSDSFDIITMWHVLEHLDDPASLLAEVRRILKSNGVLIIAIPNTDSLGFKYGRENWFHLDSPRHLILYNRKSLKLLLSKVKFSIEGFKNIFYDYPLDLFWSLRESRCKYLIYPLYPFFKLISAETLLAVVRKQ